MIKKTTFLLVFLFMIIGSCKKEKPLAIEDPQKPMSITLINDNVTPGQIVLAQVSDSFKINPGTKISVSGSLTDIFDAGENKLGFIMPVLPAGKVEVDYANAGISAKLQVTIKPYTPIQDPEIVFTQLKAEISQMKTSLSGSSLVNKVELQNLLSYYQSAMDETTAKMTVEEKLQLAHFINSNGYETTDFSDRFDKNLPDSFLWKTSSTDPTDATNIFIVKFVDAKFNGILAFSTAITLFLAPEPTFISKGFAVVSSLVAITNLAILYKLIDNDLPRLLGRVIDLEALQKKSLTLDLKDDVLYDFDIKGNFNNFTNNDKALKIFPTLFTGIAEANKKISKYYSLSKSIKSWFNISQPESSEKLLTVGNSTNSKQFYLNPKYLSISNISNPDIKVVLTSNGNRLQLKATSTTIKTKTNFTVKLKYSQANVNHSIEKTFDAVYNPTSYAVMDDEYKWVPPFIFLTEKPKTFYLTPDYQKRATGIDYSKIEVRNNTNSNVDIIVGNTSSNFNLTLKNKNPWKEYLSCDIFYNGVKASAISAEIFPDCKGLNVNLSLSGKTVTSTGTGGTAPYTYKFWNYLTSTPEYVNSNEFQLIYDGVYTGIIMDKNGCTDTTVECISNVVITTVKATQYDGTSTGRGLLEVSWTTSLGLKPYFIFKSGNVIRLVDFITASNHSSFTPQDITKYCETLVSSSKFGNGTYTLDANGGIMKVILQASTSGSTNITFRLQKCDGIKLCPDNKGWSFSPEYTISW